MTLDVLLQKFKRPLSKEQKTLVSKAYDFSKKAHEGQGRKSGEPYFNHVVQTAAILADIGMGSRTVSAGLLHDVPEDTHVTLEDVEKEFGSEIAKLVDGITKLGKFKLRGSKEENRLENLRKIFLAMAEDIRVVIIKLADRLHNMRTLEHLPREKQLRIATETIEIFAPIANRLGIGEIKGELEDLSFKFLEPENYKIAKEFLESEYSRRKEDLDLAILEISTELRANRIRVIDIHGRTKHLYRFFLKLNKHNMDPQQVYDVVAIRIIVPEVSDCYEALGAVHRKYRPLIGRIKDYISLPKPNGYKSLHTTIFGPSGRILEVQIRTPRMHDEAEFGIAAHWIYSTPLSWKDYLLGRQQKVEIPEKELEWVRRIRDWHHEAQENGEEFLNSLKLDFFRNHIFAFTPMGDVVDLPEDATPIDFAYAIHSEIGARMTGAKVDGKLVSLDYNIKNGEVVEIMTSKEMKTPNPDWIRNAKTTYARSRIRQQLRRAGILVKGEN